MAINVNTLQTGSAKRYPPVEPGTYPARLVSVILLGVQEQRPYKGEQKAPRHELAITYELLDEFLPDDEGNDNLEKPRWIHERFAIFPLDSDRAKSTQRYLALDPKKEKNGDWGALITTPVMVNVVQNQKDDRVYENVESISTMRDKEARKAPDLVNKPIVFDFYEPDLETFNALPEYVQNIIKSAVDFKGSKLEELLNGSDTSDEDLEDEIKW